MNLVGGGLLQEFGTLTNAMIVLGLVFGFLATVTGGQESGNSYLTGGNCGECVVFCADCCFGDPASEDSYPGDPCHALHTLSNV